MKKIFLTLAVIGGVTFGAFAQTTSTVAPSNGGSKFSIGFEAGLPTGDASDAFSAVIGGSLKYEVPTGTHTYFTISGGYNSYLLKSALKEDDMPSSFGFIPVKAGLKYYSEGGFFLEGQLGIVFSTEKDGGHAFVYAPSIGYTFGGGLEAGVRYESWSNDGTTSQVGLRVAYRF